MSNATAAVVATAKKSKKVSHAKPEQTALPLPVPAGPEFGMMATDSIVVLEQVRKEFDEDGLRELAEDIAQRGILQPLTVRKTDAGFVLVAGERRLRAARLAQLQAVPVLVCEIEDQEHQLAQLAENIQRQDLSLAEEADAVRQLNESGKSVTDIAAMMHKSKSWVSKRLAASHPKLSWPAKQLIEEGISEDLELILGVNTACKLDSYEGIRLQQAVKAGNAGRQNVRDKIDELKTIAANREASQLEHVAKENDPALKAKFEAKKKEAQERWERQQEETRQQMHVDPDHQMTWFWDWCYDHPTEGGSAWLMERDADQRTTLEKRIDEWYAAGQGMTIEQLASRTLAEYVKSLEDLAYPQHYALAAMAYAQNRQHPMILAEFLDWYKSRIIQPIQDEARENEK